MKILSLSIPLAGDTLVERTMALVALRNWIANANVESLSFVNVDAQPREPLCTFIMTEKDCENLKELLVWADVYFQETGNKANEYALDRLHKIFGNPPVNRGQKDEPPPS